MGEIRCFLDQIGKWHEITKAAKSRMWGFFDRTESFLIISAYLVGNKSSLADNRNATVELVRNIRGSGMYSIPMRGYWIDINGRKQQDEMFFVYKAQDVSIGFFTEFAARLVRTCKQESCLFSDGTSVGFVDGTGQYLPQTSADMFDANPLNNLWSDLRGRPFLSLEAACVRGGMAGHLWWKMNGFESD